MTNTEHKLQAALNDLMDRDMQIMKLKGINNEILKEKTEIMLQLSESMIKENENLIKKLG